MPYLLCYERHKRTEEAQRGFENTHKTSKRDGSFGVLHGGYGRGCAVCTGLGKIESKLYNFEVPVAELTPEELVDGIGGFVKAVVAQGAVHLGRDSAQTAEDPAGFDRGDFWQDADGCRRSHAQGVPGGAGAFDL